MPGSFACCRDNKSSFHVGCVFSIALSVCPFLLFLSPPTRQPPTPQVIDTLGLRKVAKSKIGNEAIRGVSGGERRRVSIGMELVVSPSLLFLGEWQGVGVRQL